MSYLQTRLDLLRRSQNPDGGWGYFPGKQSWLEPTVYASLALHGEPAADRAWQLLKGWQNSDGSWRPSQEVLTATWATALGVTLAAVRQERGRPLQAGAGWLLDAQGAESSLSYRLSSRLNGNKPETSPASKGWSWTTNSLSSPEPTAQAMVALRKAAQMNPSINRAALEERLRQGELRLLSGRNPESAGFVLLGLQGRTGMEAWLGPARRQAIVDQTPALTRAWLRLALRLHGEKPPPPQTGATNDLMLAALEALAEDEGHYNLFQSPDIGAAV